MKTVLLRGLKWALILGAIVVTTFVIVSGSLAIFGFWHDEWSGYNASWEVSDGVCNVAVVSIVGEITTFPYTPDTEDGLIPVSTSMSETLPLLSRAEYDSNIHGVLLLIDSGGGSPAGSKLITDSVKGINLPVAAYTLDMAASGAYMIASGADTIISSPYSDVGSIGVTMSYLDYSRQNTEQGLEYVELASGRFKDSGDPDKQLTAEERALFERDLAIYHETFVNEVAENRNIPAEEVAKLADGSTLPAPLALEKKLIDQIGGKEDVREWFGKQMGISAGEVIFCE